MDLSLAARQVGITAEHLRKLCQSGAVKATKKPNGHYDVELTAISEYQARVRARIDASRVHQSSQ